MSYSSNANIKKKRSEDDDRKTAELILAHLEFSTRGRTERDATRMIATLSEKWIPSSA